MPQSPDIRPAAPRNKTRFIMVRHGQSDFNVQGRVQGCSDQPSLTATGRRTAGEAGEYLKRAGITDVISSPLRRAREFADRIRGVLNQAAPCRDVQADGRLREIELPSWEGMEIAKLQRDEPELYRNWQDRPESFVMPSGDRPVPDLYARAASFWGDVAGRFPGRTVLIVTHSGTARALIGTAMNISAERFHSIQQSNGGLTILDRSAEAGFELVCLNTTGHLGESLPKLKEGRTGVRVLLLGNDAAGLRAYKAFRPRMESIAIDRLVTDRLTEPGTASLLLGAVKKHAPDFSVSDRSERAPAGPEFQTHLWAFRPSAVKRQLALALGGDLNAWPFRQAALGLTVLHYASPRRPPVVQTIDLPEQERWPVGAST